MDETIKKAPAKKRAPAKKNAEESVVSIVTDASTVAPKEEKKDGGVFHRPQFDKNMDVWVVSQCPGELHFVSKRTGGEVCWSEAGAGEWLTYENLLEIANSQKKFFERNWIVVPDDVLVSLRMDKYYSGSLTPEEYESVFDMPVDEMSEKLKALPEGQRKTISYRAAILYNDGAIDSKSRIKAIEEALDIQLEY